jgi:hypothetical protein
MPSTEGLTCRPGGSFPGMPFTDNYTTEFHVIMVNSVTCSLSRCLNSFRTILLDQDFPALLGFSARKDPKPPGSPVGAWDTAAHGAPYGRKEEIMISPHPASASALRLVQYACRIPCTASSRFGEPVL